MLETSEVLDRLRALGTVRVEETPRGFRAAPADGSGFGLELVRDSREVTLLFLSTHHHFDSESEALWFLVCLLSERCRLVETSHGRVAHKWVVEERREAEWQPRISTGDPFFPFWRPKRIQVYQNHAITNVEGLFDATYPGFEADALPRSGRVGLCCRH